MEEVMKAYTRWRDAEFAMQELQSALFGPRGLLPANTTDADLRALTCARRGASLLLRDYLDSVSREVRRLRMN